MVEKQSTIFQLVNIAHNIESTKSYNHTSKTLTIINERFLLYLYYSAIIAVMTSAISSAFGLLK